MRLKRELGRRLGGQEVDVDDGLSSLPSPIDERPGVAATHADGDLRLQLLERGHDVHLASSCRLRTG